MWKGKGGRGREGRRREGETGGGGKVNRCDETIDLYQNPSRPSLPLPPHSPQQLTSCSSLRSSSNRTLNSIQSSLSGSLLTSDILRWELIRITHTLPNPFLLVKNAHIIAFQYTTPITQQCNFTSTCRHNTRSLNANHTHPRAALTTPTHVLH